MESSQADTSGVSAFYLTPASSQEMTEYLNRFVYEKTVPNNFPLKCDFIPENYNWYLKNDKQMLHSTFLGTAFSSAMVCSELPDIVRCCDDPNVMMLPKLSIFGNRMFLVRKEDDWYDFLLAFCFQVNDHNWEKLTIYKMDQLPPQFLKRILPKSQVFDVNITFGLDKLIDMLSQAVGNYFTVSMGDCATLATRGFSLILQFLGAIQAPGTVTILSCVTNMMLALNVSVTLIKSATDFLSTYLTKIDAWFRRRSLPSAQLGECSDFADVIVGVCMTVLTIISMTVATKLPDKGVISSALNFAGKIGRASYGIKTISEFLSKHAITIYDWCYLKITGVPREAQSLESFKSEMKNFTTEVNNVCSKDSIEEIRTDDTLKNRIRELRAVGEGLYEKLVDKQVDFRGIQAFNHYYKKLEKLADSHKLYGSDGAQARVEPLVVQFFGPAGCGKSHCPYYMAAALLEHERLPEDLDIMSQIYMRNTEQEYWDGYRNQKVVIYDDFGQLIDNENNPNPEFMELIRTGNVASYPLHMASLAEKSHTNFTSKIIFLTSNEVNLNPKSLASPKAFARRISLRFKLDVHPRYKSSFGHIDPRKVLELSGSKISRDIYRLTPYYVQGDGRDLSYKPYIDDATGEPLVLTFDQAKDMVLDAYDKKIHHSAMRVESMHSYYTELCEKRAFRDAVDEVSEDDTILAQGGVSLSAIEQFLFLYWYKGRVPIEYYKSGCISETDDKALGELLDTIVGTISDTPSDFTDLAINYAESFNHTTYRLDQDEEVEVILYNITTKLSPRSDRTPLSDCSRIDNIFAPIYKAYEAAKEKPWYKGLGLFFAVISGGLLVWKSVSTLIGFFKPADVEVSASAFEMAEMVEPVFCERAYSMDDKAKETIHVESKYSYDDKAKETVRVENKYSYDDKAKETVRVESKYSYDDKSKPVIRVEHSGTITPSVVKAHAYVDVNTAEVVNLALTKSMYKIGGPTCRMSANICFIAGRVALCNWHVWDFMSQLDKITISNPDRPTGFTVPYNSVSSFPVLDAAGEYKDAVLLVFPKIVYAHSHLMKHFVDSSDISQFNNVQGILIGFMSRSGGKGHFAVSIERLANIQAQDSLNYVYTTPTRKEQTLKIRQIYKYASQTTAGDCGSLLLVNNPKVRNKICGIHVAGGVGSGYATSITRADIERTLRTIPVDMAAHIGFKLYDNVSYASKEDKTMCVPEGEFAPIGYSDRPAGSVSKSDIYKSPIYGQVAPLTQAPAIIRPVMIDNVLVDPVQKGLKKCGNPCPYIDEDILDEAVAHFRCVLFKDTNEEHRRVLSYEESITGTDDEFMRPMNRRSSPGYSWLPLTKGKLGKTRWLGSDDYILDNKQLKDAVYKRLDEAKQGMRSPHLWVDTPKVERRSLEKVAEAKTRVFSVGEMDYILLCRQYFLGFNGHVMNNRISNEIAVGINPYSLEWTQLYHHLSRVGNHVIAGDFSNYDGSLNPLILHKCLDLIIDWYQGTEEDNLVRRVLFEEIASSIHIVGGTVYQWTHSQPSGNPLTTILNSMYNSICLRLVYIDIMGSLLDFDKNISMISYGDDNVINIHHDIIDKFNQQTVTPSYAKFGMTYTEETKSDSFVAPTRSLKQVEFLKRSFVMREGRCDAPLRLDVILEMVNWVRGEFDHHELCKTTVETALTELCLHDENQFFRWAKVLDDACRKSNVPVVMYPYRVFRRQLFIGNVSSKRGRIFDDNINDEFK